MAELYPHLEPYEHGMLEVGERNQVYWEACGNPEGKPALLVHGGPGSGSVSRHRRYFDPAAYRTILFDQRGCGRSRPLADDPATDMRHNTTEHLIADMELLREHLGIEKWLLHGGSWGSTLILAYAQRYPHRVSEIVLTAVTTTRRAEVDWLTRGVGRFFPEAWDRFRAGAPEAYRDGNLAAGYATLLEDPDPRVRERAARDWLTWEDTVVSLEPNGVPNAYSAHAADDMVGFVRIVTHYFANAAWLPENDLLRNAGKLAGVPGVLLHGRQDIGGPVHTAWELTQAWPGSELVVIEDSGHTGSEAMRAGILGALDRFATS
ncbi:prolyl aminopeptidase [Amycolatopsis cihanbeyliensis]|uniref:Proline iminopeptidase n=1 Tax=Amycolatopsis cihanbeyliensis TaxID=1128664 RepID=A0A542DR07_AMYCI|nr:prolyl aminopeptidase [Amycolatopsis cihanbeyliensis]TQJ05486.1 proline iminopeptidase [Amycolatopsis cihanbeyliensis]